ncbi:MAG: SseB family protein [Microbacteriaceae bacterium]|nr:SseB family protein [Microbacteriaceae bacterium]MDR9443720.1 SseB family protein [Microbacteriaceae bacterium]
MSETDSAGVPWQGRNFSDNNFANDSGLEHSEITKAIKDFGETKIGLSSLFDSLRNSRVLVPLVPKAEGTKMGNHGQIVDTSSDMHIVAIEGPDKLPALPIFTSIEKLATWNASARPVPTQFEKALLAAAAEGQTRVIVNPGAQNWFAIRRPAIEALAQQSDWITPDVNPVVKSLVSEAIRKLPVEGFRLELGDPASQLQSEELVVLLKLRPGLSSDETKTLVADFLSALNYEKFNPLVDSLKISLVA